MKAQLEIITRRNGRFVKIQDVLVEGVQVATLCKTGTSWHLTYTGNGPVDPITFNSRDDACVYLFDMYTQEPFIGAFSLDTVRNPYYPNIGTTYNQHVDNQYEMSDDCWQAKESA